MGPPTLAALTNHFRGLVGGHGLRAQIIRGSMGSAGVQLLNRLLALALGIILARTLGADGYGVYAYAFAIMSLLMVVAEAGVPTLLMREVAVAQGREEWGLLRGILQRAGQFVALTSVFVSLAGLLVLWWFADKLEPVMLTTVTLMLLMLPFAAISKTLDHAMRGLDRVVTGMSLELLLRPLLVLFFVAAIFLLWPNLREPQYAMASQLTASILVFLFGVALLRRFLPQASRHTQAEYRSRDWLKSALPFTLIGGAGIINHQTDIIMLGWFRPSDEVGVYRVATQGAILVAFSLQVGSAVVAPHFARLYSKGDKERLQRLVTISTRVILLGALPVALAFILAGGQIAGWVFGMEYTAVHPSLAILTTGQLSLAVLGLAGPLLSMTGYEVLISKAMWVSATFNVLLNFFLVPSFGASGAAFSTAITMLAWNVYLFHIAKRGLEISVLPFPRIKSR